MSTVKTEYCDACTGFGWLDDPGHSGNPVCPFCNGAGTVSVKVKPLVASHRTMVARLVRHYANATERDMRQGVEWYTEARKIAEALSAGSPYSVEQCAYVIAALSPNVAWDENVKAATYAVESHKRGIRWELWQGAGYGTNKEKASRILDGDLSALKGPKVTNFARGIMGDPDACTIDLWMLRSIGSEDTLNVTPARHKLIRRAIEVAAVKCGHDTNTFQAIVWSKVRNETLAKNNRHAWRVAGD